MNDKLPVAVMPIHDPEATLLPYLQAVKSDLQRLFSSVALGLTWDTGIKQAQALEDLRNDPLFQVHLHGKSMPVGAEFRALYSLAASSYPEDRLLHLCFPDRIAFVLSGHHRSSFMADIPSVTKVDAPLLFQRSEAAWQSHPDNYRQLEAMVTTAGALLFGRSLDFAWCHLAVTAGQLAAVLPGSSRRDMSFLAEIVLLLRDQLQTKDVDWLAWEDPFFLDRDPLEMKAEREADPAEVRKRLSYVVPMLEVLAQAAAQ